MKKTFLSVFVIVFAAFLASCSPASPAASLDATPTPPAATTSSDIFILANFQLTDTMTTANCTIEDTSTDTWINNATVTIAGQTIPFVLDGVYSTLTLPGTYATGDTVTLNVTTSYGTATASGTIPASGASANAVAVSGAKTGSIFYIAH